MGYILTRLNLFQIIKFDSNGQIINQLECSSNQETQLYQSDMLFHEYLWLLVNNMDENWDAAKRSLVFSIFRIFLDPYPLTIE
jgi:hypothetical protein